MEVAFGVTVISAMFFPDAPPVAEPHPHMAATRGPMEKAKRRRIGTLRFLIAGSINAQLVFFI
jgi:hypothetical protein